MKAKTVGFDFFSTRLAFIKVSDDPLLNLDLWHYLDAFEGYVYGVFLQYNRIVSDLSINESSGLRESPVSSASLDIYFYILTWDKLKKIHEKISGFINRLQRKGACLPKDFFSDFRLWERRVSHLFKEFDSKIRNEYEHPSMESYLVKNVVTWGNIFLDSSGKVEAHVGKNWFATIKVEHVEKIMVLRTDLFDLFIKHFLKKPLTRELLRVRDYYEGNIDSILSNLKEFKDNGDFDGFNDLLYRFTQHDMFLAREGVRLSNKIRERIYSLIWSK